MVRRRKSPKMSLNSLLRAFIREVDGSLVEVTGKPLKQYVAELIQQINDGNYERIAPRQTEPPDPYAILGVTRGTPRPVVKQVYLAMAKLYHEAGAAPNPDKMRDVNNAYQEICRERGWPK